MNYSEVLGAYQELYEILLAKKEAISKKDLEKLSKLDETNIEICERIKKFDIKNNTNLFNDAQKEELRELGRKIKTEQENNEILINHSLNVINNLLSGIINITAQETNLYNSKGENCVNGDSIEISSITEEA